MVSTNNKKMDSKMKIFLNQRWYSQGEPELGLGIVVSVESKTVTIAFLATNEERTYGIKTAPLKRIIFEIGDHISTKSLSDLIVKEVNTSEDLIYYTTNKGIVCESDLDSKMELTSAQDKFFALSFDDNSLFKSRYESYIAKRNYQLFKHKGLLGSRVRLIDHQAYITSVISNRDNPKVLLSDEVGLGKTIESSLILSSLILKNKSQNSLIVVPDSLVYQWFFELKFKFNLEFKPISENDELDIEVKDLSEDNNFIISSKKLKEDKNLLKEVLDKSWDTLIVDEVHQYVSELDIAILDEIANRSKSILFLSATPKINGKENHYKKLEILEPNKFTSYEEFIKSEDNYSNLLPIVNKIVTDNYKTEDLKNFFSPQEISTYNSKEKIISALVDRHGTGRLFFRNTRDHLEKFDLFFPKRILHKHEIKKPEALNDKIVFSLKLMHLKNILTKYPDEKILLLVHSKDLAKKIHTSLGLQINIKMALFYSEQSLMERDRQAAFFSEPDGARLLICTEIGSEGRNFEFASHIFLFDLPKVSEQLEQRIGRLDRVGQKKDINIHVPYIKESFEEILFRWYDEVFKSFSKAPKGAAEFYEDKKDDLLNLLQNRFDQKMLDKFIESSIANYSKLLEEIAKGHDALLDLNSFNHLEAKQIINEVNAFNDNNNIMDYLLPILDSVGVNHEELNENSFYIQPSETMLIPSYPGLSNEGQSFTVQRDYALYRDDLGFLSWEHPLTINTIELFTGSQIGNTSLVTHDGELPGPILFELIFKLEAISKLGEVATDFLPLTPIRVLIDSKGSDITNKFPKKYIDQFVYDLKDSAPLSTLPKDAVKSLFDKAANVATIKRNKYVQDALKNLTDFFDVEITKLKHLEKINPLVDSYEVEQMQKRYKTAKETIDKSKIQLDAIRVILKA